MYNVNNDKIYHILTTGQYIQQLFLYNKEVYVLSIRIENQTSDCFDLSKIKGVDQIDNSKGNQDEDCGYLESVITIEGVRAQRFYIYKDKVYLFADYLGNELKQGLYEFNIKSSTNSISDGKIIYEYKGNSYLFDVDFVIYHDIIYAVLCDFDPENSRLIRMDMDGSNFKVLDGNISFVNDGVNVGIYQDKIYYYGKDHCVCRTTLNGDTFENIKEDAPWFYNEGQPWCYNFGIAQGWLLLNDGEHVELIKISNTTASSSPISISDDSAPSNLKLYANTFYKNYDPTKDLVYLYDVTNDGVEDMLVVDFDENSEYGQIYGKVYTINDGKVEDIYTIEGGEDHASGFFCWYIRYIDNKAYLANEYNDMWQGYGALGLTTIALYNDGKISLIDDIMLSGDGDIPDTDVRDYNSKFTKALSNGLTLYYNYSEVPGGTPPYAKNALMDLPTTSTTLTSMTNQTTTSPLPDLSNIKVGDHFYFGSYPQTESEEVLPIEWRVIDVQGDKVLVISEYLLDRILFNEENISVTWENCTQRSWLNGYFYSIAFSDSEKSIILSTLNANPDNPKYGTDCGNNTVDMVFSLNIDEAEKYFADDVDRRGAPTAYAIKHGAWTSDKYALPNGMKTDWWWLRSSGQKPNKAVGVIDHGEIRKHGADVNDLNGCIRPAMWLSR